MLTLMKRSPGSDPIRLPIQRFSFDDFKDTDTIAAAQRRNKELTFDELDIFIREHARLIDKIGAKAGGNRRDVKARQRRRSRTLRSTVPSR